MEFIGIDLHSNRFNICILDDKKSKGRRFSYTIGKQSLESFYEHLDQNNVYVMLEASTNSFAFAELIIPKVKKVYIANTHKLKLISMVKKKTDRIDAEKLATFLKMQVMSKEKLIHPVYIPDKKIQELRSLFTTHKLLRKNIASLKNRIHSLLKQNLYPYTKEYIFGKKSRKAICSLDLLDSVRFQISLLYDQLDNLEKAVSDLKDKIIEESSPYRDQVDVLTSMKGISIITAIALIADIADIKRFESSKNLTSYLRSAPSVDSSNETTRIGKTNKFGRKLSLSLLMQSMNHFRDSNPRLKAFYNRTLGHKKGKVIRVAMGRRVLSSVYHMLKNMEYHHYMDERFHEMKMQQYDNYFMKKKKLA